MLNFREELNKIKEEKRKGSERIQQIVESCLKGLLDYFETRKVEEFFKELELEFEYCCSRIDVTENPYGKRKEIYSFDVPKEEAVSEVLISIEQKLISEGFELSSNARAAYDGRFCIRIKF